MNRGSPYSTGCPFSTSMALITPDWSASISLSSFMASIMHRVWPALTDCPTSALGADAVFGRQLVQRHAAGGVVVDLEPALLDDAPAARIEHLECPHEPFARQLVAVARLEHPGRLGALVGEIRDRRVALLAVVGLRLERDIAAGHPRLHLDDFGRLHVEGARHVRDLLRRQRSEERRVG